MTSPPAPLRIVALVLEPDRDAVAREAPQVLLQAVVELPCPLAPQEVPDRLAPFEELLAVAPLGVLRVGKRYLLGVAGVPGILGRLDLLSRRLLVEGWYGRSDALVLPALLHVLLHSLHSALMLAAYDSYADATAALGPSTRVRSISVGMLRCRGAAEALPRRCLAFYLGATARWYYKQNNRHDNLSPAVGRSRRERAPESGHGARSLSG